MGGGCKSTNFSRFALLLAVTELYDRQFMVCFLCTLILWLMDFTDHKFPVTQFRHCQRKCNPICSLLLVTVHKLLKIRDKKIVDLCAYGPVQGGKDLLLLFMCFAD